MPGRSTIAATSCAVWFASEGRARCCPRSSGSWRCPRDPSGSVRPGRCDAGVRPGEPDVGPAHGGHPDEVEGPAPERPVGRGERDPAPDLEADRGGGHLLLGDVHLEVALGEGFLEQLRVGRVVDVAVEGDDLAAGATEGHERLGICPPRRLHRAPLVSRQFEVVHRKRCGRASACGLWTATVSRAWVAAPSSASARSSCSASSAFPCIPFRSATPLTPLPLIVRATIAVGRPVTPTASPYAAAMASTS